MGTENQGEVYYHLSQLHDCNQTTFNNHVRLVFEGMGRSIGELSNFDSPLTIQVYHAFLQVMGPKVSISNDASDLKRGSIQAIFTTEVIMALVGTIIQYECGRQKPNEPNIPWQRKSGVQLFSSGPQVVRSTTSPRRSPSKPTHQRHDRSTNTIYLSKLPEQVTSGRVTPLQFLASLGFPSELVDVTPTDVRIGKHKARFVEGPQDKPDWAASVVQIKPDTLISGTNYHLDMAHPRPNRKEKVRATEEIVRQNMAVYESHGRNNTPPHHGGEAKKDTQEGDGSSVSMEGVGSTSNQRRKRASERPRGGAVAMEVEGGFRSPPPKTVKTRASISASRGDRPTVRSAPPSPSSEAPPMPHPPLFPEPMEEGEKEGEQADRVTGNDANGNDL